jgi:solute carrier family 45 protein 1/2/4
VAGFWIMDLSINTVQGPFRSILSDLLGPTRQDVGNAVLSGALAVGTVGGYFTGSRDLSHMFPFLPGGQVTALFSIAIAVLLATVAVTLFAANERPLDEIMAEQRAAQLHGFRVVVIYIYFFCI